MIISNNLKVAIHDTPSSAKSPDFVAILIIKLTKAILNIDKKNSPKESARSLEISRSIRNKIQLIIDKKKRPKKPLYNFDTLKNQ